jgi:hypothetical protein
VTLAKGAVSALGIGSVALSVSVGASVCVAVALGSGVAVRLGAATTAVGMPSGKANHAANVVVVQSITPAKLMMSDQTKKRKPACPAARRCRQ